jgi:sporulation protein YlmC with PRC-barrel domain
MMEFKEVIMKRTMTTWLIFAVVMLASNLAFAGGNGYTATTQEDQSVTASGTDAMFEHPQRLSTLLGIEVTNTAGENLGKIHELIADEEGRISYLVIARGGMMGVGADLVAVPTSAVEPVITREGKLSINLDKETLKNAPAFAASNFPTFFDTEGEDVVRGYFPSMNEYPASGHTIESEVMDLSPEVLSGVEQSISIGGGAE